MLPRNVDDVRAILAYCARTGRHATFGAGGMSLNGQSQSDDILDPASSDVATIGGVIANNAGGMRCTLERNSYHTVSSLTLVLASGTVIDAAAPDAEATFAKAEPELAQGLLQLREELLADDELAQRIRHKFAIRNTNGYSCRPCWTPILR